ncbi:MAG: CCA tRNA nucleotidyltransferase [Bacilli bacterium]|nr:CCA tRNA nucleotidyltransferase [Bacilli bacterium]
MKLPEIFLRLSSLYAEHGHRLFLIGGTSRDLLLGIDPSDIDLVTDATPEEEKAFLPDLEMTFARFGSVHLKTEAGDIDITTMRRESGYKDSRHPSKIEFIRDLKEDSLRRDFTINALYIDCQGNVSDYHGGLEDLKNRLIRFIGDPATRIQEDPLRILRAERFAKRLSFQIEENTQKAMEEHRDLLRLLNPEKIAMEMKKE